ncbi:MAG: hypothetical protein RR646_01310 [Erysipelotrichaceae bacterium]
MKSIKKVIIVLLITFLCVGCVHKGINKDIAIISMDMNTLIEHLENVGINIDDKIDVKPMNIGALEGIRISVNENYVYLYQLDLTDQRTIKLIEEAKSTNFVKVSINDSIFSYHSIVNGSYLMLYESNDSLEDIIREFSKFRTTDN